MKYQVTAGMFVVLRCIVEARSEDEAIGFAKKMAEYGQMEELEHTGDVTGWSAHPVQEVKGFK